MTKYYGLDGEPISDDEWMRLFEDPKRLLKQEWLHVRDGKRYWVSTVWLGIDHNHMAMFRDEGAPPAVVESDGVLVAIDMRPWIFETMVFENRPAWDSVHAMVGDEVLQERHATLDEALQFHDKVKERL